MVGGDVWSFLVVGIFFILFYYMTGWKVNGVLGVEMLERVIGWVFGDGENLNSKFCLRP